MLRCVSIYLAWSITCFEVTWTFYVFHFILSGILVYMYLLLYFGYLVLLHFSFLIIHCFVV
jgi:hypothetical protein